MIALALVMAGIITATPVPSVSKMPRSLFPPLPHTAKDACWVGTQLAVMTTDAIYIDELKGNAWQSHEILRRSHSGAETLWALDCHPLFPDGRPQLVVTRVRDGVWRSVVMAQEKGVWGIATDDIPYALRWVQWKGEGRWMADPEFQQDSGDRVYAMGDGKRYLFEVQGENGKLKLGQRSVFPIGTTLDNWNELPTGEIAVLRREKLEIWRITPKLKKRQRLPGNGSTTVCAMSQTWTMSGIGYFYCRLMPPLVWGNQAVALHSHLLIDDVFGRKPMIEHADLEYFSIDPMTTALRIYQRQGPFLGEISAYFIDKNPVSGAMTLFLLIQDKSLGEALSEGVKETQLIGMPLEELKVAE